MGIGRIHRTVRAILTGGLVLLISCSSDPDTTIDPGTVREPVVASVTEIGPVYEPPTMATRDGGATAVIGGDSILWLFGDTFFTPASEDGTNLRTNTAAIASPADPLAVREPLDSKGAPYQGVPFTAEEKSYNDASGKPDERIALWPGGLLSQSNGDVIGFIHKLYVHPGLLNYEHIGVELVRFPSGSTTAIRLGSLFTSNEPMFTQPLVDSSYLYLYGMIEIDGSKGIGVARVLLSDLSNRSSYRFWDGSTWNIDAGETATIFTGVPGGVSVSYNSYLHQFTAVHSLPLSNTVAIRTASRPEGPWSDPKSLFNGQTPDNGFDYAGAHHPELEEENGRVMVITYYHPLPGFLQGELIAVKVRLE